MRLSQCRPGRLPGHPATPPLLGRSAASGPGTGHLRTGVGQEVWNQISRQQLTTLGLGVGLILRPDLARYADLAQTGLGLLSLRHSREAEREADTLGLRYLARDGYDPDPLVDVFTLLGRVSQASGTGRLPSWLSTHPEPEDRRQRIAAAIRALPAAAQQGRVEREGYLRRIDGIVFGDDPREGYFENAVFYHPGLRFRITFPPGWKTTNQKQSVAALSPSEDALVVVTLAAARSAEAAARDFFGQGGVQRGDAVRAAFGGLPAVAHEFAGATQQGELRGVAAFVEHGGRVFRLLGYTPVGRWRRYAPLLLESTSSFARLTDSRRLDVAPSRLDLVALPRAMSLREFHERYPSSVAVETLALINQVEPGAALSRGALVKRVIGGDLPARASR